MSSALRSRFRSLALVVSLSILPIGVAAQKPDDGAVGKGGITAAQREQHDKASAIFQKAVGHYRAGRLDEATKLLNESVRLLEKLYPQGHPDLAIGLHTLGAVFQARGDAKEARKYYEAALDMRRRFFDESQYPRGHPELLQSLEGLAALLKAQRELEAARKLYEEALSMLTRLLPEADHPEGHPRLATTLYRLGSVLEAQGELFEARKHYERSLAMWRHLYPVDTHPDGHLNTASTLESLGAVLMAQGKLGEARTYLEEALEMRQRLYGGDESPRGHPQIASSLNSLGDLMRVRGGYGEARIYYENALAMRRQLFPASEHPRGNQLIAQSLSGLGILLRVQGEYAEAKRYNEKALAMYRRLYPSSELPEGHPYLAVSLTNLGSVLGARGDYEEARKYGEEALAMNRRLYPPDAYPRGHLYVVASLTNLGLLHIQRGDLAEAGTYYEKALAMDLRLYPSREYPDGHNELAGSLANLGLLLAAQGVYEEASRYSSEALAMTRRLYPPSDYSSGHSDLAQRIEILGMVRQVRGDHAGAAELLLDGARMRHELASVFFAGSSEAEALNFAAANLETPHRLISTWGRARKSAGALYGQIWTRRGELQRLLSTRRKLLEESTTDAVGQRYESYVEVRRQLASTTLEPADRAPETSARRRERLAKLTAEKEKLERSLAAALPGFRRHIEERRRPHTDLARMLPDGRVFVDVVFYVDITHDPDTRGPKRVRRTPSYVAFVARRGEKVRRVDLGPSAPIDAAVLAWRKDIQSGASTDRAAELRGRLWEPLEAHFGSVRTTAVYLRLDGGLSRIPWAALRGRRDGSVLLEDYAIATVSSGQLLLEQLDGSRREKDSNNRLLVVGDVAYDVRNEAPRTGKLLALVRADQRGSWLRLPATKDEMTMVADLGRSTGRRRVRRLTGVEASPARVLRDLPRARWAHFATHGFFASPEFRARMQLDPAVFEESERGHLLSRERTTAAGRNPLVLSGLVLAGANRTPRKDRYGIVRGDDGILTAESIAAVSLEGLELAVLSACETGLGEVAGGEGVYGLQRAFHQAGARNVIASLWKVDDEATAALMRLFYHGLWVEKKPPIEALRRAQLAIYREPGKIGKLARTRGNLDVSDVVELSTDTRAPRGSKTAPVRLWAAFSLSGVGE